MMKKLFSYLFLSLLVMGVASCSDDALVSNESGEKNVTQTLSVTGTIVDDATTRVSLADGGTSLAPSWEVDDQVFGFYGENKLTYQVASIADGVATFSLVNGTEPADGTTVHMIYAPGKSATDIADGQLAVDLSQQDGTLAGVKNHAIMCATATVSEGKLTLSFLNQVAILGVKQFTGLKASTTYTSATFSAYGPTAKVSVVDGELKLVTDRTYGTITATGSFASDESGNTTETIYFAVPPHETAVPHTFDLNASDDRRTGSISAKAITAGKYLYMPTKQMEENSLVQQWLFDGNTNNSVSSVNAVLGSSAPTLTTDRFGNANSAYYFNGSSTMTVPEEGFNFGTNSFTENVWICTSSSNVTFGVTWSANAYQSNGCYLRIDQGRPMIWEGREQQYSYAPSCTVNDGKWHMLTYVRDVVQRKGSLYIDGIYQGGYDITGVVNNVTRMLSIGFVDTYDYMIGKIDDIQLYNKALSAKQIANLYAPAPPIVGSTGSAPVLESAGCPNNECGWVQLWENGPKFATMFVGSTEADFSNCTSYSVAYCGGMYGWDSNTATTVWGANWTVATLADYRQMYAGFNTSSEKNMQLSPSIPNEGTNCIWEWMDGTAKQYVTGCTIQGWKVSGKGAYAANSIFFPLSGCNGDSRVGSIGVYYTATNGNRLYFDNSGTSIDMQVYAGDRYHMLAKLVESNNGPAPVGSVGSASVTVSDNVNANARTSCGWVLLWDGGPRWAEFNVGASATTYAGMTEYSFANTGGLYSFQGKRNLYPDVCGANSGDTATELWGTKWRTPTSDEEQELLRNCDFTYCDGSTVQYVTGCTLKGWKVTGRGGYAGNSIFLPLAGVSDQNSGNGVPHYYNDSQRPGNGGWYWAVDDNNRIYLNTTSQSIASHDSPHGCSVRAVLKEQ